MPYYIQRKGEHQLETVDEFETFKEARKILVEHQMSDNTAQYYLSTRPCKNWDD